MCLLDLNIIVINLIWKNSILIWCISYISNTSTQIPASWLVDFAKSTNQAPGIRVKGIRMHTTRDIMDMNSPIAQRVEWWNPHRPAAGTPKADPRPSAASNSVSPSWFKICNLGFESEFFSDGRRVCNPPRASTPIRFLRCVFTIFQRRQGRV